ncbi:MAG: type II secretion system protein GspN [Proteobacteria bacterium]|nr:type II secretion system protein GspN [Pseudomonadota bacterium]
MSPAWKRFLLAASVVLYVGLTACLSAHYGAPYASGFRALRHWLEGGTPLRLSASAPAPGRPFTIRMARLDLALASPDREIPLITLNDVRIGYSLARLLFGELRLDFQARAAGGRLRGRFSADLWGDREMRLELLEADLPQFALSLPSGQGAIAGRLQARAVVLGKQGVIPTGGQGEVLIADGRLKGMTLPAFPFTDLDFERLEAKFSLETGQVLLERFRVEGKTGGLQMAGRVRDYARPVLELKGEGWMGPDGRKGPRAGFRVFGPALAPRFEITSTTLPGAPPSR